MLQSRVVWITKQNYKNSGTLQKQQLIKSLKQWTGFAYIQLSESDKIFTVAFRILIFLKPAAAATIYLLIFLQEWYFTVGADVSGNIYAWFFVVFLLFTYPQFCSYFYLSAAPTRTGCLQRVLCPSGRGTTNLTTFLLRPSNHLVCLEFGLTMKSRDCLRPIPNYLYPWECSWKTIPFIHALTFWWMTLIIGSGLAQMSSLHHSLPIHQRFHFFWFLHVCVFTQAWPFHVWQAALSAPITPTVRFLSEQRLL